MDLFSIFFLALALCIGLDLVSKLGRDHGWFSELCESMIQSDLEQGKDTAWKTISMFTVVGLLTPEQVETLKSKFAPSEK